MESPTLNLVIFLTLVALAVVLFWPRIGFLQVVRGRMRMTRRTQLEDALKYMYDCELNEISVTSSKLAEVLQIVSTKTSELTTHMGRAGLVSRVDGRILLTEKGKRYAIQIIRAHRLWERYLADETGVKPKEWHTIAEEREHMLSPEEANALAEQLGNPDFDPHGDPIPSADGEFHYEKQMNLTELTIGECARVVHMEDEPEEVYEQLVTLGVFLSMEFRLISVTGNNYVVEADDHILVLTPELSRNLSVKRIEMIENANIKGTQESLAELQDGEIAEVIRISPACHGFERRRLLDLGILPSTKIQFYKDGLTGGLSAYNVRGTVLALRHEQVRMISICDRRRVEA